MHRTTLGRITTNFGQSLVVFSPFQSSLVVLNSTARLIWEMLSHDQEPEKIANQLSNAFNIAFEKAQNDVEAVRHLWNSEDLPTDVSHAADTTSPFNSFDTIALEQDRQPVSKRTYAINDRVFSIAFQSAEIEAIIQAVLGHRECPAATKPRSLFTVLADKSDYCLIEDGVEVARENSPHRLRHALIYEAAKSCYPDFEWLIFLHAGAVSDGKRCILMPGMPGCGKSTLTAALSLDGYHYVCEDIAPITRKPWSVASVQTRICLREGGWMALKQKYPDLTAVRGGRRWGKQLRYVLPPNSRSISTQLPVQCIIFPEYTPGAVFQFAPISSEEMLARLIQTGAWFSGPQDEDRIKELLAWIETTPGYQLRYQNSEEAMVSIRHLFSNE
jgi:hypothetical protein